MNINPILNHIHTPDRWPGADRTIMVGNILFQSGTHINPDIALGERHAMAVSAIIRRDGIFELEMKTRKWEDGLGVFYSDDTVDEIFNIIKKKTPNALLRRFTGEDAGKIRYWITDTLREVRAIEREA